VYYLKGSFAVAPKRVYRIWFIASGLLSIIDDIFLWLFKPSKKSAIFNYLLSAISTKIIIRTQFITLLSKVALENLVLLAIL
jgi:hypothetical protein